MRRILLAFATIFALSAMSFGSDVAAQDDLSVAFTIHAASCSDDITGGFYETCHDNGLAAATFTLTADGMTQADIVSGVDGVGEALILTGMMSADNAVLTATSATGGWVYCKDQISGYVLADRSLPESGSVELGSIFATQWIICDVYQYDALAISANG